MTQLALGNTLTEALDLNARLQSKTIALCPGTSSTACGSRLAALQPQANNLVTLQLGYDPSNNNGNVQSLAISGPNSLNITQSYSYNDTLNRLTSASESTWSQTYNYDPANAGNRWVTATSGSGKSTWPPSFSVSPFVPTTAGNINPSNNQLSVSTATSYDCGGNQTTVGAYAFSYDAEGRVVSSTLGTSIRTQYTYDGEGQRVMKVVCPNASACTPATNGATSTTYAYDADGSLAAEYSSAPPPPPCVTCYVTVDQLGSTRLLTDSAGNVARRYDYLPFGEEIPADGTARTAANGYQTGLDNFSMKFTGQMRDRESGLDFFNARYYSPAQGRFVSADRENAGARMADPQTWNGYSKKVR